MRTSFMPAYILPSSVTVPLWQHAASQVQRFLALATFALAAALGCSAAIAGGLQVSPVSLALAQTERAGIITVSNNGEVPMTAQARIFKWTQTPDDEYVLEPTSDILLSPPIMQLAPGVPQELRLIRAQAASAVEQQYRLIIDQLPSPQQPSDIETSKAGVKPKKGITILIRHNLPVFLNSTDSPLVALEWRAQAAGKDKTRFSISNNSKNRAQIARLWLQKGEENTDLRNGLTGYVLPGSTLVREFNIPLAQIQAADTTLKAQINGAETTIKLGN